MRRLLSLLFVLTAFSAQADCTLDQIDLRGEWGQARFTIEIADTPEARAQGLMHRESMPARAGMLFVYEKPAPLVFWMRNTLIPLDIIFADQTGTIVHVHENAIPLDETHIPSNGDAMFVLEVNGGVAELYGIGPGSELRHPAIAQDAAAWPCQE